MVIVTGPKLKYATNELEQIEACIPVTKTKEPITKLVTLKSGTKKDVISHLPKTSIAHFACHGIQGTQNPLKSALILENGELVVSQIMQHPSSNGMLAFLSACQTAMGDKTLPDEVIHLASTLLFAGFPGVVATMW